MTEKRLIPKLRQAIKRKKESLIKRVEKKGIYENFGQKEIRDLEDKYIDSSSYTDEMNKMRDMIRELDDWACTYNG